MHGAAARGEGVVVLRLTADRGELALDPPDEVDLAQFDDRIFFVAVATTPGGNLDRAEWRAHLASSSFTRFASVFTAFTRA